MILEIVDLINYYGMEIATAGLEKSWERLLAFWQDSVLEETWGTVYIGTPMLKERAR